MLKQVAEEGVPHMASGFSDSRRTVYGCSDLSSRPQGFEDGTDVVCLFLALQIYHQTWP